MRTLRTGAAIPLPDDHEDRGLYILQGIRQRAGGALHEAGGMLVFRPGEKVSVEGPAPPARG